MSLSKNAAPSRHTLARRPLARATRPVLEALEGRQLLSGTLSIVNPYILPGTTQLMFNTMGTLNTYVPANVVHNQQTLTLKNTGAAPLTISSMSLSGPFVFVTGTGNVTTLPAQTIAANSSASITIAFVQSTVPAHTGNETNYTSAAADGASIGGSLTINSSDTATPAKVINLEGYFQQISNNNEEPGLATIVNTLAGYKTNLGLNGSPDYSGSSAAAEGSEVLATSWATANPAAAVTVQELATFRTQGNAAALYWYSAATQASHRLLSATAAQGQTLLPTTTDGGTTALRSTFTPNGAFGLRVDNEYSSDAINNADGDTGGAGHHFRFFPLVDQSGNAVPNTYIVAMDYGITQAENFDFNDNVYIVSNIRPAAVPDTPTGLTVSSGSTPTATPTLNWTASNYSPVGYNVYRSTTAAGPYNLLTSAPISATTYTDSTLGSTATTYYKVTAVDTTTRYESAGATVTANAGPVVSNFTFAATSGVLQSFNALANATDATGTINPATVVISTAPSNGGTAVANPDGTISYTPSASYTGNETLQYTVADSNGVVSQPGTVTFVVSAVASTTPTPSPTTTPTTTPTFNPFVGFTLVNTPVILKVLGAATSGVTLAATNPVTIVTGTGAGPFRGTAVANADGTITYTPSSSDVGGDSFTYRATSADGVVSLPVTVNVNVGVQLNAAKPAVAYNAVTFTDQNSTPVTVSLNKGQADVYFDGTGLYTAPGKGKTLTVAGGASNQLHIREISLTGTTAASALTIKTPGKTTTSLGGIYDASPIGTVNAKSSNLLTNGGSSLPILGNTLPAGYIELHGVKSLALDGAINADVNLLTGTGVASTAVSFAGAVNTTYFSSATNLSKFAAVSWNASSGGYPGPIAAPAINSLTVPGTFGADLTVTGNLGTAKVGAVSNGTWDIAGSAKSVTIASTAVDFGGLNVGAALTNLTVSKGNLSADVTAASIGNLKVAGTLSGNVTTTGNLNMLSVGALDGALVEVGTGTDANGNPLTLSTVTAANIGGATLKSLTVTGGGKTPVFNDAQVIAHTITSATTGLVDAATTSPEGIAAVTMKSAAVNVNGGITRFATKTLVSEAALQAYLTSKGATLGNFDLDIVSATPV